MEQNNQNQFKCTGDCLKCTVIQRQYCASQFTYNTMRMVEDGRTIISSMQETLSSMQGTLADMKAKIEAIQGNEATLFDPTKEKSETPNLFNGSSEIPTDHTITQSGDGVIK